MYEYGYDVVLLVAAEVLDFIVSTSSSEVQKLRTAWRKSLLSIAAVVSFDDERWIGSSATTKGDGREKLPLRTVSESGLHFILATGAAAGSNAGRPADVGVLGISFTSEVQEEEEYEADVDESEGVAGMLFNLSLPGEGRSIRSEGDLLSSCSSGVWSSVEFLVSRKRRPIVRRLLRTPAFDGPSRIL